MPPRPRTTAQLKEAFIKAFSVLGIVTAAADKVQIGRRTIYDWRAHDPEFAAQFEEAEIQAAERLEAEAYERATGYETVDETSEVLTTNMGYPILDEHGQPRLAVTKRVTKREYSPTLLIFLLKARNPDKFRDRFEGSVKVDGKIQHSGGVTVDFLSPEERERVRAALTD